MNQVLIAYHKDVNSDDSKGKDIVRRYSFNDVATKVNELVSENVRDFTLQGENDQKPLVQVSEVRSSLCVNLYFYPNQDSYEEYMTSSQKVKEV